jgi:plastocyanin
MKWLAVAVTFLTSTLVGSALLADQSPAKPKAAEVVIQNMKFVPDKLEILTGQTVTWTNKDDRDHTVTSKDGSFKSDNLGRGEKFEHKFSKAGTFAYGCSYHPRMKASIIVKENDPQQ